MRRKENLVCLHKRNSGGEAQVLRHCEIKNRKDENEMVYWWRSVKFNDEDSVLKIGFFDLSDTYATMVDDQIGQILVTSIAFSLLDRS